MAWVRQHRRWNNQQWAAVLFTDESRFHLDMLDRRGVCGGVVGNGMLTATLLSMTVMEEGALWFGEGSVHLVVINGNLTGQRYIDEVLRPVVVPFLRQHQCQFQDDNARPHRARIVQEFLRQNNVVRIEWPARSPDMSPIEHVWDILGRRVRSRTPRPRTLHELAAALQDEWRRIPQQQITRGVRSMRRRCQAVYAAYGGHTRY